MNILMFGRGVIAAQYGWALEKAGHKVEFYVRPGRAAEYGPYIDLDTLDGRENSKGNPVREKWNITMREEIKPDHNYDLIIISVNHNQLDGVMKTVGTWAGKATILMFNNIWDDMDQIIAPLPKDQVIWGFPGGGGSFTGARLRGGFVKSIFLESAESAVSKERYQQVVSVFENAGFKLSIQKDIRSWYWDHFIMNAAMGAQSFKEGGYSKMYRSPATVKKSILLMRELLPLIKARGGTLPIASKMIMRLPAGLTAYGMYKLIGGKGIMGEIMRRGENPAYITHDTMAWFPRDVLATARQMGVSLPKLKTLESYF